MEDITNISNHIGYKFHNKDLLKRALTHRSTNKLNNERLEYLGDAILGFIIAEYLYCRFPEIDEGGLTCLRACVVNREMLATIARKIGLSSWIIFGSSDLRNGSNRRDSILSDTIESLIGAIYMDSDIDHARQFILDQFADQLAQIDASKITKDAKNSLQEYLQARQYDLPEYRVINITGEQHDLIFTVECKVNMLEDTLTSNATGTSKKKAEQDAAQKLLETIHQKDPEHV